MANEELTLPVKEVKRLEEGKHEGTIVDIVLDKESEYMGKKVRYVGVIVKPDDADFTIKVGYPDSVSEASGLGKRLIAFGADLKSMAKKGETVKPAKYMKGKKVVFLTVNEEVAGKGVFARIVADSLKPK